MENTSRFRIYTEAKNLGLIENFVGSEFEGFTMFPAKGVWEGNAERSVVVEIITQDRDALDRIRGIVKDIKIANQQQAVFVTRESIEAELI